MRAWVAHFVDPVKMESVGLCGSASAPGGQLDDSGAGNLHAYRPTL